MGNKLDDLGDKGVVRGDLSVPVLDIFPKDDSNQCVQLQVNIVAAGQRRQHILDGCWRGLALVLVLRTQDAPDQIDGGLVGEGVCPMVVGLGRWRSPLVP